jgi:hypothetical protein
MLQRGADVFFYSSFDSGLCFLYDTSGGLVAEFHYHPGSFMPGAGQVFAVTDLDEWVSCRKIDIERFLLLGLL